MTSVLCLLALSACGSDSKSSPSAIPADSISMTVDEKRVVQLQAPIGADRYWLSYDNLPLGWSIPIQEQTSAHFEFEVGPVGSNTLFTVDLHQLIAATDTEEITSIQLQV